MRRTAAVVSLAGATVFMAPMLAGVVFLSVLVGGEGSPVATQPVAACGTSVDTGGATSTDLSEEQLRNAATIIQVGQDRGVPPRGWTLALATALQESGLRNLTYGDRDSLGLFQQRPSQGWGAPAQVLDPVYASGRFYAALLQLGGWEAMPLWRAAQTVQRSAFPFAYARHESLATALVRRLADAEPGACSATGSGAWVQPVRGYRLTSPFGPRIHPIRGTYDLHTGLDFAVPTGAPVVAASAGTVTFAGPSGGYGNLVKVRHAEGVETWYAHLSRIDVRLGQELPTGARLGAVGSTGSATGPHLHLEVRVDGSPVDPQTWLAARGLDPARASG